MRTFQVNFANYQLPVVQADDGRFLVPLRPVCQRLGITWNNIFQTLFSRPNIFRLSEALVEIDNEFTQMTVIPVGRLGWWMKTTLGRPTSPKADWFSGATAICDEILEGIDIFLSTQISGNDPTSQYVLRGKDLIIADLQRKIQEQGKKRGKNRLPRALITLQDVQRWREQHAQGRSYAEIGDEANRSPATVRRAILEKWVR